jgi:hypothetical protein
MLLTENPDHVTVVVYTLPSKVAVQDAVGCGAERAKSLFIVVEDAACAFVGLSSESPAIATAAPATIMTREYRVICCLA